MNNSQDINIEEQIEIDNEKSSFHVVGIQDLKLNIDEYSEYLKEGETVDGGIDSVTLYDLFVRITKQDHHKLPSILNHHQ